MTTTVLRSLPGPGQTVDVLIVGGGITGAAIAYEAASRGLSVALVEKGDFNTAGRLPVELSFSDVVAAYGGLRPLTETTGTDTYRASRASELVDHARDGVPGIVTATGGKYTTARAFAEKTVPALARAIGRRAAPSRTADVPLDGADLLDTGTTDLIDRLYGSDAGTLRAIAAESALLSQPATDDGELLAGVAFAARHEAVEHLTDILLNRTGIGRRGDPGEDVLTAAADVAGAELDWTPDRRAAELDAARTAVRLPD